MRWKWRIGLFVIAAVEIPTLLWAAVVVNVRLDILAYVAGVLTATFLALLALRPILFGITGLWLAGIAGGAWYFLRFVPPGVALLFGAVLSTLGCAVGSRFYVRVLGLVLHRHI